VNKNINTKLNRLDVTEEITHAQFAITFLIFDHKNEEICEELSLIKLSICSISKFFKKSLIITENQNQSNQEVL
jgi:hypothetical protein